MIIYNANFNISLNTYGISIPLLNERFDKVYEFVDNILGPKNKKKFLISPNLQAVSDEYLLLTHKKEFIQKLKSDPVFEVMKTFELVNADGSFNRYDPNSQSRPLEELVDSIKCQVSETIFAARDALETGFSFFIGGGLHHAMSFGGRGFCLLNDIVIASNVLVHEKKVQKIWIIDVDAHKGCGTAELCRTNPSVISMSIHMKDGWPLDSNEWDESGNYNPWFIPSDIDIEIEKGEEPFYVERLEKALDEMDSSLETPDLVFIVQGTDAYEFDELESAKLLSLSLEQMTLRDQFIFDFFSSRKIPQCYLMSGGYGKKAHEPTVEFLKYALPKLGYLD